MRDIGGGCLVGLKWAGCGGGGWVWLWFCKIDSVYIGADSIIDSIKYFTSYGSIAWMYASNDRPCKIRFHFLKYNQGRSSKNILLFKYELKYAIKCPNYKQFVGFVI